MRIENGKVAGEATDADWGLEEPIAGGASRHTQRRVNFQSRFAGTPHVSVSIYSFDIPGNNARLDVYAEDIDNKGFDIVFHTWGDTTVHAAKAEWIAIGW